MKQSLGHYIVIFIFLALAFAALEYLHVVEIIKSQAILALACTLGIVIFNEVLER